MNCKRSQALLDLFIDGQLNSRLAAKIEKHLLNCKKCQTEKVLLEKSWDILDSLVKENISLDFTEKLMKRIHLEQAEIKKIRYTRPVFAFRLAPALTPVLILLIMITIFSRRYIQKKSEVVSIPKIAETKIAVSEKKLTPEISLDDEAIIRDLELLQDLDLLYDFDVINNLDFIENIDDAELSV